LNTFYCFISLNININVNEGTQKAEEEKKMNWKKALMKLAKQKRGMMGLEAAIILIAFVIIAGAFSFMVINQGLYATERGKTVVQEGLRQASTPLSVDGTIFVKAASATTIGEIVIPLRAYGVKYVALGQNETAVTLQVAGQAWPNIYEGTGNLTANATFDDLSVSSGKAKLFIQNSNGDSALDSSEKGYLKVKLNTEAQARTHIVVEIRPEKASPLTIDFYVPESLPTGWTTVAG
jgi:flagellin FlaB